MGKDVLKDKKFKYILLIATMLLSLISVNKIEIDIQTLMVLVIISSLIFVKLPYIINDKDIQKYKSKANVIGIALVSIISSFCVVGRLLFMSDTSGIKITFKSLIPFLLVTIYIMIIVITLLYIFEKFSKSIKRNSLSRTNGELGLKLYKKVIVKYLFIGIVISLNILMILDNYVLFKYKESSVTIQATAETGEFSNGNEVWIEKIIADGNELDLTNEQLSDNWSIINDKSIIYNNATSPSEIKFNFDKAKNIKIFFSKYSVAGVVNIIDGGKETQVDLSSNDKNYLNHYYIYDVQSNVEKEPMILTVIKYIALFSVIFCIIMSLIFMYYYKAKKNKKESVQDTDKIYWIVFFIVFVLLEFWAVVYYPGNYSWDNLYQWAQATDMTRMTSGHPILMTIAMRYITQIWKSPFAITTFNTLIISLIIATMLKYLYLKGIKKRYIIWSAIIFSIIPTNIMMSTNVLKDVPSTFLLLLLMYYIFVMIDDNNYFSNNLIYIIFLPLVLAGVYLLRHDAIIAYYLSVIFIVIYNTLRRNYKIILSCICSFGIVYTFNTYAPKIYNVEVDTVRGVEYTSMLKALGNVVKNDGELSEKSLDMLENIMPLEIWKDDYSPYNQDTYSFNPKVDFQSQISNLSFKDVFSAYIDGLINNPGLIIRDRLDGMDIIWNVCDTRDYESFKYYDGVMTFYMVGPEEFGLHANEDGVYRTNNFVSNLNRKYISKSTNIEILSLVFWRSGIYICILLVLIIYMLNNRKANIWMIIPIVGRTLAFMLMLSCQHYRYVYYIPICVMFMIPYACSSSNNNLDIKKD